MRVLRQISLLVLASATMLGFCQLSQAATVVLSPLDAAADGSSGSLESTFANGDGDHQPAPAGWTAVGTSLIDTYGDPGYNGALCINWPTNCCYTYTYTAQFTHCNSCPGQQTIYTELPGWFVCGLGQRDR
jgi:hypothetical protein